MYDLKCNADLQTHSGQYSALNLVFPWYNRESERRTFSASVTRLWNSLPIKKGYLSHLLTRYNDIGHFYLSKT